MGRKLSLYLIITIIFSLFTIQTGLHAQCNNPNGSDFPAPPGPTSCDAVSFCNGEINGYCGQLGGTNVTWPSSLCNGNGVPNNMEWLAFVAAYTTITITITPFNCPGVPGGFQGIQAGIYDDCETGPGAVVPGACQTACSTGPINLTSNNFIVGNVYYLFIDGCSGDMCEYVIDVTPFDATALPDLVNPVAITGPTSMCAGATGITYSIPEIFSAIDYVWTVPAGWTVNQTLPGNEVTIDFPNTTTSGQICVVAENDCHDTDPLCITVNVAPIPPTNDIGYYCEGESFIYDSNGESYTNGSYSVVLNGASYQGCDSTVLLNVIENPDVTNEIDIAICQGEDYFVCGAPYELENTYTISCGPNFQGCDSTIILNLFILEPSVDIAGGGALGCDLTNPLYLDGFNSEGDSFLWTTSDGDICDDPTSPFIQVCAAGTYCLTSTIEMTTATQGTVSCTAQECVVVTSNSELPMTTSASTDIACNGETNGTATITVSNTGIGPFTYNWVPNVSLTNTASGLTGGTYMVTVTADNGCSSVETIEIDEPAALVLSTTQTNGSCDGSLNGTATVTPSGGTAGYSYAWCNGQTTEMATSLPVGQCCVTVTDASNCTEEICVDITTPTPLTISTTQTNVDCNGASTGGGTVTVGGGTAGYTYLWCNGATTATVANLPAGECCVVVTDANNCTIQSCIDLTEPTGMNLTTSQTNVSCEGGSDGSATVTPTGGAGGYTYLWCNNQTTQTATDLPAVACEVVVTDANGCTSTAIVTPTQPAAISLSTTQMDVNCIGQSDGSATVTPTGGAGGFTFLWCNTQTTQTATDLPAGPCQVVVTDANGCTSETTVILTEPATAISISGTSMDAACGNNNGSIDITVSGGTAGYTYQWSPSGGVVEDPTGLGPGTYTVVVTDANTCTETFSIDVNVPSGLSLSNTVTDVSCNGGSDGSIDLVVTGGTGLITYLWDNGAGTVEDPTDLEAGTYNVTVTDAAGCEFVSSAVVNEPDAITASGSSNQATCGDDNGSISIIVNGGTGAYNYVWTPGGSTDQNPVGLAPANYSVLITDANGCTGTTAVEVTTPDPIQLSITPTDANCNGADDGSIDLEVTGGTAGYSYAWTGTTSISQDPIGLTAGNYEVTVTDADNCTMVISTVVGEPTPIVVAFTTTETICGEDNGTATVTVNGGSAPYDYAWNNGAGGNTPNPTGLEAITYEVTVTDDNGCSVIETIDVGEIEPMDLSISANDANCNGGMDGSIDLEVTNGTGPFTYTWTNTISVDQDPVGLSANNYEVLVTDANGCTETIDIDVDEPSAIEITGSAQDAVCGDDNGAISINVNGGAGGYTYLWSPTGDLDEDPSGLGPGTYSVVVTDANNCTETFSIDVETPSGLALSAIPTATDCNSEATGSIDLDVAGGTGPFQYIWDNNETTQDIEDLAGGIYCVTVTDATNCTIVLCETIDEPAAIEITGNAFDAVCGEANGSIAISVNGGTGTYDYLWTPGGSVLQNPTGLAVDSYSVLVTDENGCTGTFSIDVEEPNALFATATPSNVSCNGGADGSIDLEPSGGLAPYTYDWSSGSVMQDPTGLSAGSVVCIITDANDCTFEIPVELEEPDPIEVSGISSPETCGDSNGSITSTVVGGTGPYTYVWMPGNLVDPNPSSLAAANYTVEVTDVNGCIGIGAVEVLAPNALLGTTATNAVSCNGGADGTASVTANGGNGPYTYQWLPIGGTNDVATDLPAGDYTVVVTDADGCSIELPQTVIEPTPIVIDGNAFQATCGEANGSITTTVSGGTGPYNYLWMPGALVDANPSGLLPDDYTLEVTDGNGCIETFAITVGAPAELTSSAIGTDVSCFGGTDGTVDITVEGGTAPYTYIWSNGSTDEDPTDFTAGPVTGTATDANGCTTEIALVLGEPTALTATGTSTDETCGESNGSITITPSGGTAPYSYIWDTGLPDAPDQPNLSIGTYCVDVTDANACVFNICVDVVTPNALTLSATPTDANCFGSSDGNIDLEVTGGVGPYTYDWTTTPWNGEDLNDIPMGTYTVIVTDATLCTATLTQVIGEPTLIEVSDVSTPAVCGQNNGASDITATGGVGPYTYLWSNGSVEEDPTDFASGNYICTVTDANLCTATHEISVVPPNGPMLSIISADASCFDATDGAADLQITGGATPFTYAWSFGGVITEDIANLPAGNYTVTVTDNDGCTYTASTLIEQPEIITINGNATDETCNASNGTITISVAGGTGTYTYLWSPSGSVEQNPTNLAATDHTVVVTDANGCTGTQIITVDAPNALIGDVTPTNISCDGGSNGTITANISGGVPPYEYLWSPMGGTGQTASGLPVGNYTVLVTDGAGCEYTITQMLTAPPALDVNGTASDATCGEQNGSIDLTVTGGVGPYDFLWVSGLPPTEDQANVGAGSYTCIVTDANDCTFTYEINVNTPNMLLANAVTTDVSCNNGSDGTATVTPSGGVGPYTYLWMPGGSTAPDPSGLPAGNYTVSVTDATNCTVTASAVINEPTAISISDITTPETCGDSNGTADITVTGGTAPYTYLWSTGSMDEDPDNFGEGDYDVIVTDANGCSDIHTVTIDAPGAPNVSLIPSDASCNGDADGGINVTVTSGIPPFSFLWSTGDITEDLTAVIAGDYTLTITDNDGCTTIYTETVGQPVELTASTIGPNNILCNGGSNGSITLDVVGGTMPYSFDWDNGAPDVQDPFGLSAGTYNVTVTDANGCTALSFATLTEPTALMLDATPTDANCNNATDGSIDLTVTGGTGTYIFAWSNTSVDEDPVNLGAGNYVVVVTDDNGCTESTSALVAEPAPVTVTLTAASDFGGFNLSCANSEDGFAEVQAAGGFAPFEYLWDNGTTGPLASDLGGGTYAVIATDNNGCTGTTSVSLEGPEDVYASAMVIDVSCYGDDDGAIIIDSIAGGTGPYLYSLDGGDFTTSPLFGNLVGANYDLTIQDANGCESVQAVQVIEPEEIAVVLPADFEIQLGDSVSLEAQLSIDTSLLQQWGWTEGQAFRDTCTLCLERWIYPFESGSYEFLMIDDNGCLDVESVNIRVRKDRPVYIPNAFSPNGDGRNDYFQIYLGAGASNVKTFKVFNRWGEIVYELSDFFLMAPDEGWDGMFKGNLMNPAVFVFYAEVEFLDGHVEIYKGDVSLMR